MEPTAVTDDDAWDALLVSPESTFINQGWTAGAAAAQAAGQADGYELGAQKGFDVGAEIGFYYGAALVWQHQLRDGAPARITKALDSLLTILRGFPVDSPLHATLFEQLEQARAKFRLVATLLGSSVRYRPQGSTDQRPQLSF